MKVIAECLSFQKAVSHPALEQLAALPENAWPDLLLYTDRTGLTLYLLAALERSGFAAPQARIDRQEKNRLRLTRTMEEAAEVLEILSKAGLRAAMLKGFTLEPEFVANADLRSQYDLDLFLSLDDALRAHRLLLDRGYEQILDGESLSHSHLPTLVRKTGWEWRGDYYDLDIPRAVELHHHLWNADFERLPVNIDPQMEWRDFRGRKYPVLRIADQFSSVVLHAIKHILHGNLRIAHLYELGYFMERHSDDRTTWPSLGRLTAAAFGIAAQVFGAQRQHVDGSLPAVEAWARRFSHTLWSPEKSSKCEVLLNLALLESNKDRAAVLRRRLLPTRPPDPVDAIHLPQSALTPRRRALRLARQAGFFTKRAWFHARSIPGFTVASALWFWERAGNARSSQ